MTTLLLKDVAEVLGGAIRRTDYLARVSPDGLSAVLVGCKGREGALAFLGRAERALERVTEGRPAGLQLSYGIQRLADCDSTSAALELAEASARTAPVMESA
jgi:GGDEF domain-containing protein